MRHGIRREGQLAELTVGRHGLSCAEEEKEKETAGLKPGVFKRKRRKRRADSSPRSD